MAAANLIPCPDCGQMLSRLAESCPSCARPLRASGTREGLFLRTLNQLVALVMWGPFVLFLLLVAAVVVGMIVTNSMQSPGFRSGGGGGCHSSGSGGPLGGIGLLLGC